MRNGGHVMGVAPLRPIGAVGGDSASRSRPARTVATRQGRYRSSAAASSCEPVTSRRGDLLYCSSRRAKLGLSRTHQASGEAMKMFVIALVAALAVASVASARGHGGGHSVGRVSYGGGHHTSSHGGSFSGGSGGSSHRGGHYNSPFGGHSYGTHK
jgi:hypothetical protein